MRVNGEHGSFARDGFLLRQELYSREPVFPLRVDWSEAYANRAFDRVTIANLMATPE